MISSKEAVQKVIEEALKFRHIHVLLKIEEAIGHRMASDLKSICHSPPFDQSAMDGYAFRLCDIQSNEAIQISKDENSAGKSKIKHIKPHTAIRIFTGAKIPSNADVVIPQELVEIDEKGNLQFNRSKFKALDNIRTKGSQFKKGDVIILLSLLLMEYKIENVTLRNDNGSQFIATVVRQFLKDKGVNQEFTHVATPEENAYIESLHSNVQREVVERYEFESIYHAQLIFNRYYDWYNNHRKHGSLGRKSPEQFLKIFNQKSVPYKTEKKSDIVSNFNPVLSKN